MIPILWVLYVLSIRNYLLFHTLVEFFSLAVAFAVFLIALNTISITENNYLLFIGVSLFFIGAFDLLHMITYRGIGILPVTGANVATQLWVSARYFQGVSFVAATFFIKRRLRLVPVMAIFGAFMVLTLLSIFTWKIFPLCYVEGVGLTPFKKISELIVCGLFAVSLFLLVCAREAFDRRVLMLMVSATGLFILSELAFMLYSDVYGIANVVGHLLRVVAVYLIYYALVRMELRDPYNTLFRELKKNEDALKSALDNIEQEREHLTNILNSMKDGVYIVSREYDIEYANPAMIREFGPTTDKKCYEYLKCGKEPCEECSFEDALTGRITRSTWQSPRTRKIYDAIDAPLQNIRTGRVSKMKILRDVTELKRIEQQLIDAKNALEEKVHDRTLMLQRTVTMLEDEIRDRIKAEEELILNQERLRALSKKLTLVEERHRREIATFLHDTVAQILAAAKMELSMLHLRMDGPDRDHLRRINDYIGQAVEQTRGLTFEICSPTLYMLGLEPALEELAEQFSKKHGFECEFVNCSLPKSLSEDVRKLLYRSARELLVNISKHAGAAHVTLSLERIDGDVQLTVRDDGAGFDLSAMDVRRPGLKGFGLFSLREHLRDMDGSLTIDSSPGRGTVVILRVPMQSEDPLIDFGS